jgi:hypothetical protein
MAWPARKDCITDDSAGRTVRRGHTLPRPDGGPVAIQLQADAAGSVPRNVAYDDVALADLHHHAIGQRKICFQFKDGGVRRMDSHWGTCGLPYLVQGSYVVGMAVRQENAQNLRRVDG